jgi:hypothetical protein
VTNITGVSWAILKLKLLKPDNRAKTAAGQYMNTCFSGKPAGIHPATC